MPLRLPLSILMLAMAAAAPSAAQDPPPAVPAALQENSEPWAEARERLPTFRFSSTPHYVLLTDAPQENVKKVLEMLESTHDAFHVDCRRLKLDPAPLRHKLVAILFADKNAYLDFARTVDRVDRKGVAGYYQPQSDRLVIYDIYSSPDLQQNLKILRDNERKITQSAPANKRTELLQKNRAERRRLIGQAEDSFLATVGHEAAHQLFFHTGIQDPGQPYPLWVAEGLATVFEVEEAGDETVGFFADNDRLLKTKRAAAAADRLVPLQALVITDKPGAGADAVSEMKDFYAQSHVLVSWMARFRPTEFRLYLAALKEGIHGDPRRRQPVFESIFGPVAALERVWLRAEARRWLDLWETPAGQRLKAFETQGAQEGQPQDDAEARTIEPADAKPPEPAPPADPAAEKPSAP